METHTSFFRGRHSVGNLIIKATVCHWTDFRMVQVFAFSGSHWSIVLILWGAPVLQMRPLRSQLLMNTIITHFMEDLRYSRLHSADSHVSINFILKLDQSETESMMISIHRWWGTENLSNLLKDTQLIAGTQLFFRASDLILIQSLCSVEICRQSSVPTAVTPACSQTCHLFTESELLLSFTFLKMSAVHSVSWPKAGNQPMFTGLRKAIKAAHGFLTRKYSCSNLKSACWLLLLVKQYFQGLFFI